LKFKKKGKKWWFAGGLLLGS